MCTPDKVSSTPDQQSIADQEPSQVNPKPVDGIRNSNNETADETQPPTKASKRRKRRMKPEASSPLTPGPDTAFLAEDGTRSSRTGKRAKVDTVLPGTRDNNSRADATNPSTRARQLSPPTTPSNPLSKDKPTHNKNERDSSNLKDSFVTPRPQIPKKKRRVIAPSVVSPNSVVAPKSFETPLVMWMNRNGINMRFRAPLLDFGISTSTDIAKLTDTEIRIIRETCKMNSGHATAFENAVAMTRNYKLNKRPTAANFMAGGGGLHGERQRMIQTSQTSIKVLDTPELGPGALGVFTSGLPNGTFISWYDGQEIDAAELARNESKRDTPSAYIMQLNTTAGADPMYIDATEDETGANFARRVNNCGEGESPNCTFFQDDGMVYLCTLRDIKPYEQLTVDYDGGNSASFIWPEGTQRLTPRPFCTPAEWNDGEIPPVPYSYTRARIGTTDVSIHEPGASDATDTTNVNEAKQPRTESKPVKDEPTEPSRPPALANTSKLEGSTITLMSANLNSFRKAYEYGLVDKILELEPDIVAIQEHMLFDYKTLLEKSPKHRGSLAKIADAGYHISVNECREPRLKGHHGTMVISKIAPNESRFSAHNPETDREGRVQIEIYDQFILINIYAPQPGLHSEHTQKRSDFMGGLTKTIKGLRNEFPTTPIVMCGDMNVAPTPTDCFDTRDNCTVPGHKPQEREAWIQFRTNCMFEDIFETLEPGNRRCSTWWPTKPFHARMRDRGLRLDHFLHDAKGRGLQNIEFSNYSRLENTKGSDHCPIQCNITFSKPVATTTEPEPLVPQQPTVQTLTAEATEAAEISRMTLAIVQAASNRGREFKVQFKDTSETQRKSPWILIEATRKRGPFSLGTGKKAIAINSANSSFTLQSNASRSIKPNIVFTIKNEDGSIRGHCSASVKQLTQATNEAEFVLNIQPNGGPPTETDGQLVITHLADETQSLAEQLATMVAQHHRASSPPSTLGCDPCPVNPDNTIDPVDACECTKPAHTSGEPACECTPNTEPSTLMANPMESDTMVFFHRGWPSQFATAPFYIGGVRYFCCEQFMMAEKARTFRDRDAEQRIMNSSSPIEIQTIGREVRNYDETTWNNVCRDVVLEGNFAKYTQNRELRAKLLETGDKCMVEASPQDSRWGVGLRETDPRIHDPRHWKGTNWLGHAINTVRQLIRDGVETLTPDIVQQANKRPINVQTSPSCEPTEEMSQEPGDHESGGKGQKRRSENNDEINAIEQECAKAAAELSHGEPMKPCPHLDITTNGRAPCKALADSGATTCIAWMKYVCQALDMTHDEVMAKYGTKYGPSMKIADGSRVKTIAHVPLSIEFTDTNGNKHRVKQHFWVMENLSTNIILGIELWRKQGLHFNFDNDTIVMNKALPNCEFKTTAKNVPSAIVTTATFCRLTENITIPAKSSRIVRVRVSSHDASIIGDEDGSGSNASMCNYGVDGRVANIDFNPSALVANGISKLRGRSTVIKISNFSDEDTIKFKHDKVATFTKLGQEGMHFETTMVDLRSLEPGHSRKQWMRYDTSGNGEAQATEANSKSKAGHFNNAETPATTLNKTQSSPTGNIKITVQQTATINSSELQPHAQVPGSGHSLPERAQQPGGAHYPSEYAHKNDISPTDGIRNKSGPESGSEATDKGIERDCDDDVRVLINACHSEIELITRDPRRAEIEGEPIEGTTADSQTATKTPQQEDPWATTPLSQIPLEETKATVLKAEGVNGEAQFQRVKDMLADNNRAAVYKRRTGVTKKDQEQVRIITEGPPQGRNPSRVSPAQLQQIRSEIDTLLRDGQIEPSESPWAAGVVLADKKDGTARFCVDLRLLNAVTKRDAYPLPRIDDTLARMAGLKWISTVDFKSAFWQLPLHPDDKEKTAFATPDGLYHWNVMPMGLRNASSIFSRFIAKVVGELRFSCLLTYIDDVIIFSKSFDDHLRDVAATLDRLNEWGVVLKPSKCHYFLKQLDFLGHVVSEEGISVSPAKTEAIDKMPEPTTAQELRAFLGMTGYYRTYIEKYAKIVDPLMSLLRDNAKGLRASKGLDEKAREAFNFLRSKLTSAPILAHPNWDYNFEIHCDASPIGLGAVLVQKIPDPDKPDGKPTERVIQYASRTTKDNEKNYCQYMLECAALIWSVRLFRPYVAGGEFTIVTDNTAVKQLVKKENLGNKRIASWILELQEYNFTIAHRPGAKHGDADGPSRNPVGERTSNPPVEIPLSLSATEYEPKTSCPCCYSHDSAVNSLRASTINLGSELLINLAENYASDSDDEIDEDEPIDRTPWMKRKFWGKVLNHDNVIAEQLIEKEKAAMAKSSEFKTYDLDWDTIATLQGEDKSISSMITRWLSINSLAEADRETHFNTCSQKVDDNNKARAQARNEIAAYNRRIVRNGGIVPANDTKPKLPNKVSHDIGLWLNKSVQFGGSANLPILFDHAPSRKNKGKEIAKEHRRKRIIVPPTLVPTVMREFHGNPQNGHLGKNRTQTFLCEYFSWRGMYKDIANWIKACTLCARRKPPRPQRAGLTRSMGATRPGQIWCIDYVGPFPEDANGNKWILTMHDQFTRWPIAVPTKERTVEEVIKHVVQEIVLKHGPPEMLWSDREPGFAGQAMKKICQMFGVKKAETTGYQPQANSTLERFHSFMAQALTLVVNKHKKDWHKWLESVLWMYRTSVNSTTGYSPFYLLYGREPRIPILAQLGMGDQARFTSQESYGQQLMNAMREAYANVRERQQIARLKDKNRRDGIDEDGNPRLRTSEMNLMKPGSLAMFWEPEKRVKSDKKPRKLEFRYTGPWRVHRECECKLHRWIIHTGREKIIKVNVNRLREFTPWDTEHIFTDPKNDDNDEPAHESDTDDSSGDELEWGDQREEGELVIVPFVVDKHNTIPWMVGKVLQWRAEHPNGHLIQWHSNTKGDFSGPQLPGWVQIDKKAKGKKAKLSANNSKHYFGTRTAGAHAPYTNDTGGGFRVSNYEILQMKPFKLDPKSTLPSWVLDYISNRDDIQWTRA